MRIRNIFTSIAIVIANSPTTLAVANSTAVAQQISQISPCGLKCLQNTIPEAGCSFLNTECQCSSSKLVRITAECMYANCTYPETLDLSRIQATICERPRESLNHRIRVMTIVGAVISITAVALRLLSKHLISHEFGLDDLFVVLALISHTFFGAFGVKLEQHGFGEHVWTIDIKDIQNLFLWFYICEILYILTIGFVKVSLLFFYLRVFPKRTFRIFCHLTTGFVVIGMTAFILASIFQCTPVRFVWDKTIVGGKCLNYNAAAWCNAAINILQDFIIVVLPIRETMRLQLSAKQKLRLSFMFCVGGFVCVASLIRLESLLTFGLTADPTWDNIPVTFWSTIETTAAIVCVCMPAIRAGIVHLFPFFSTISKTRNDTIRMEPNQLDTLKGYGDGKTMSPQEKMFITNSAAEQPAPTVGSILPGKMASQKANLDSTNNSEHSSISITYSGNVKSISRRKIC